MVSDQGLETLTDEVHFSFWTPEDGGVDGIYITFTSVEAFCPIHELAVYHHTSASGFLAVVLGAELPGELRLPACSTASTYRPFPIADGEIELVISHLGHRDRYRLIFDGGHVHVEAIEAKVTRYVPRDGSGRVGMAEASLSR